MVYIYRACAMIGSILSMPHLVAQWDVRLFAGAGASRIRTDLGVSTSRGEYQVVDHRFSWMLGASAEHQLSGPLSFTTGLNWSFIAGHDEHWIQQVNIYEVDRQIHYLYLPMMVQVALGPFQFGAGYQLGVPILESGTFRTHPYANGFGSNEVHEVNDLALKKTDMGVVGEARFRLTDRWDIGARYYHGLLDVKDHSDGIMSPLMNEQLIMTIGYRILPGQRTKATGASPALQEPME